MKSMAWGLFSTFKLWSRCIGRSPNLVAKFVKICVFMYFLKKRKMGYFKSKNLCDKISKIKNLRLQFSCIFRRDRRGILCFFCRWSFHGEICDTKLPFFYFQKKKPILNVKIRFFWDTIYLILLHSIGTRFVGEQ